MNKNTATKSNPKADHLRAMREQKQAAQTAQATLPASPTTPVATTGLPGDGVVAPPVAPVVTPAVPATPKAKKDKIPMGLRLAGSIKRRALQLEKLGKRFAGWEDMSDHGVAMACIKNAVREAQEAAHFLEEAAKDGYAPKGAAVGGGGGKLQVGAIINIREKARSRYEDALEPGDMEGLTVLKVIEKKGSTIVSARTKSGDRVVINRGQIEIAEPAA